MFTKAEEAWLYKNVSYRFNEEYRKPRDVIIYRPPRKVYLSLGGVKEIRRRGQENGRREG